MPRAKLTGKGRVTIPRVVRERLGLQSGDEIDFEEERGVYTLRKHVQGAPFQRYRGFLTHLDGCDADALILEMRGP
jgi:AbrB family looped-hinge helix DNA binding protein